VIKFDIHAGEIETFQTSDPRTPNRTLCTSSDRYKTQVTGVFRFRYPLIMPFIEQGFAEMPETGEAVNSTGFKSEAGEAVSTSRGIAELSARTFFAPQKPSRLDQPGYAARKYSRK